MVDVFISYKSERRPAAAHLARILELHGYSVWFDYELISGRDFARQIEAELRGASVCIVIWCSLSVGSEWVLEEAHLAKENDKIVPVRIEPAELPFGFTRLDTIDLSKWDGSPLSHSLNRLWDMIEKRTGREPAANLKALRAYEDTWRRFGAPPLTQFALAPPLDERQRSRAEPVPAPHVPLPTAAPPEPDPPAVVRTDPVPATAATPPAIATIAPTKRRWGLMTAGALGALILVYGAFLWLPGRELPLARNSPVSSSAPQQAAEPPPVSTASASTVPVELPARAEAPIVDRPASATEQPAPAVPALPASVTTPEPAPVIAVKPQPPVEIETPIDAEEAERRRMTRIAEEAARQQQEREQRPVAPRRIAAALAAKGCHDGAIDDNTASPRLTAALARFNAASGMPDAAAPVLDQALLDRIGAAPTGFCTPATTPPVVPPAPAPKPAEAAMRPAVPARIRPASPAPSSSRCVTINGQRFCG